MDALIGNASLTSISECMLSGSPNPRDEAIRTNVHATPKGITFRLGSVPGTNLLLAGPSIYGLTDPAHGAALSLVQITTRLLTHEPTFDRLVRLYTLMELEHKIGELFSSAQSKLETESTDVTSTR